MRERQLPRRDLAQITVDTTVQEKTITHPTDSKPLYTAIRKLGDEARSSRESAIARATIAFGVAC